MTGINLQSYLALRKKLGLSVNHPPMVYDPMQMLPVVEEDILNRFRCDAIPLQSPYNAFGSDNRKTKYWEVKPGITCRVASGLNIWKSTNDNWVFSPEHGSQKKIRASMPSDQMFFDILPEKEVSITTGKKDFSDRFSLLNDEVLRELEFNAKMLHESTDYGIIGNINILPLGGFNVLHAPWMAFPKGICSFDHWLESLITNQEYIHEVFSLQCETAMKNVKMLYEAIGERIEAIFISGTDFGTQNSTLFSPNIFRNLYKPYYTRLNSWIHANTSWKTFFHSCGAIADLLNDFVEMGVDIINPIQFTAQGMSLKKLKENYGGDLVFWGGGVDTQHTLPDGPEQSIIAEVINNCELMSKQGGFVFSTVHNIQADVKPEHIIAAFDAVL